MKKLSVILLATVFVFGLAVQAGAGVTEVGEEAFTEDELINFTTIARGEPITTQFPGVLFSDGLYGEDYFSIFLGIPNAASNINLLDFMQTPEPVVTANFVERVTRVGFDVLSPSASEIIVTVYRDGSETSTIIRIPTSKIFVGVEDPEGIDAVAISGDGFYSIHNNVLFTDNLRFGGVPEVAGSEIIDVAVDIKPRNCMNPFNIKSEWKVPVVIIGSADFDVSQIDPASVRLSIKGANLEDSMQSVAPLRDRLDDVGYCNAQEPDGFQDLTLKFDTQELVAALEHSLGEALQDDHMLVLQLSGNLYEEYGGAQIRGEDSVTVLAKEKQKEKCKDKKGKKHKKHKHKNKKVRNRHGFRR